MRLRTTLISLALVALAAVSVGCSHDHSSTASAPQPAPVTLSLYQGDSAGRILLAPGPSQPAFTSTADQFDELMD